MRQQEICVPRVDAARFAKRQLDLRRRHEFTRIDYVEKRCEERERAGEQRQSLTLVVAGVRRPSIRPREGLQAW